MQNQELLIKLNQLQSKDYTQSSSQTTDNDILNIEPLLRYTKQKYDKLRNAYVNTDQLSLIDSVEENKYKIQNLNLQNNQMDIQQLKEE